MVPPRFATSRCDCMSAMTGRRAVGLELGAVGVGEPADVAGELDDRHLQAETDAEEREVVLARPADGLDHPVDAALAEPAGDEQAVEAAEEAAGGGLVGELVARQATRSRRSASFGMPPWMSASCTDL